MTKTTKKKLAYMAEYQKQPEQEKKRVERNRARRHAISAGKAHVGDGTDVDHKHPLDAGGSGADSNTRVTKRATNRGWRKEHPDMYGKGSK